MAQELTSKCFDSSSRSACELIEANHELHIGLGQSRRAQMVPGVWIYIGINAGNLVVFVILGLMIKPGVASSSRRWGHRAMISRSPVAYVMICCHDALDLHEFLS